MNLSEKRQAAIRLAQGRLKPPVGPDGHWVLEDEIRNPSVLYDTAEYAKSQGAIQLNYRHVRFDLELMNLQLGFEELYGEQFDFESLLAERKAGSRWVTAPVMQLACETQGRWILSDPLEPIDRLIEILHEMNDTGIDWLYYREHDNPIAIDKLLTVHHILVAEQDAASVTVKRNRKKAADRAQKAGSAYAEFITALPGCYLDDWQHIGKVSTVVASHPALRDGFERGFCEAVRAQGGAGVLDGEELIARHRNAMNGLLQGLMRVKDRQKSR